MSRHVTGRPLLTSVDRDAPVRTRTGVALGAVCAVDTVPRPWGRAGLDTIKSLARELIGHVHRREDNQGIEP